MHEADSRPRLTALPKPIQGIYSKLVGEYIPDPTSFNVNRFQAMQDENPHLASLLAKESFISPDREKSLDWR